VLEKDGEDHPDRPCEKRITYSEKRKKLLAYNNMKQGEIDWTIFA
jgi:hypothetical protein